MGDQVLKKTTLLITLSCLLFAGEKTVNLSWVDQEIEAIKPPRKGVSNRAISLLKDPFIFLEKNRSKKKEKKTALPKTAPSVIPSSSNACAVTPKKSTKKKGLKLMAVINNSALINDKWYKVGEHVGSYKIVKVTLKEVVLKSPTKTLTLTTYTKKLKK